MPYLTSDNVGGFIQFHRMYYKMSQKELADKVNISRSTLAMYEQGRRVPDLDTTMALLRALGLTLNFVEIGKTY